jgi:hypothetical protein
MRAAVLQLGDNSAKPLTTLRVMLASRYIAIYRVNYNQILKLLSHPDTIAVMRYEFVG